MIFGETDLVWLIASAGAEAASVLLGVNRTCAAVARKCKRWHFDDIVKSAIEDVRHMFPRRWQRLEDGWEPVIRVEATQDVLCHCVLHLPVRTVQMLNLPVRKSRCGNFFATAAGVRKALAHTDGVWGLLARRERKRSGKRLRHTPVIYGATQRQSIAALQHVLAEDQFAGFSAEHKRALMHTARLVG